MRKGKNSRLLCRETVGSTEYRKGDEIWAWK